ncbi:MAG: YHYH domain-containing protein [bacterium]|nr:YHYH domain-containing protein [bacterium]
MKKIIILAFLIALIVPQVALAHPGRTDKKGGHTCKTNCSKWGLKYGQYHYHNKSRR